MPETNELNEQQLEYLFNRYYEHIHANFLFKTKSQDIADDLTQATFIRLWKYRSSFTTDIAAEAQLYRKAKQVFIDWLRREAHQRKITKAIESFKEENDEPKLELTDLLHKAINQLPLMRKKVFTMSYVEGHSHKEIADMLNISIRTVEGHIQKALLQLRKSIAWYSILAAILLQHGN